MSEKKIFTILEHEELPELEDEMAGVLIVIAENLKKMSNDIRIFLGNNGFNWREANK